MAYHVSCYVKKYFAEVRPYTAKYNGICDICKGRILQGDAISWSRRQEGGKTVDSDKVEVVEDGVEGKEVEAVRTEFGKVATAWRTAFDGHKEQTIKVLAEMRSQLPVDITAEVLKGLQGARKLEVKVAGLPKVDVGHQHKQFDTLVKALVARVNVWLAGPSGSGKTTGAMSAAKALGLEFFFTGAISDAYGLTGYNDANGRYVRTAFREAWEKGGVFLWDEVDASDPTALLAFNAALANSRAAFPDGIIARHPDCVLIAAANTYGHGATQEYVGRMKLDAAFLKRFAFISWGYDEALEMVTAPNPKWTKRVQEIRKKVEAKKLRVLVTPRESYLGAQLLAAGLTQQEVEEMLLKNQMTPEQWQAIC